MSLFKRNPQKFLRKIGSSSSDKYVEYCKASHSQLGQEILALSYLGWKENGFFVEFGACDGVEHSNTSLLESQFNWSGILAEPGRVWQDDLARNRNALIDKRCVWTRSGETAIFNQSKEAVLSTLDIFSELDHHAEKREDGSRYEVETVSLNDLLVEHKAPKQIDYMSVDTEGSEYDILSNFNFSRHDIAVITVEHNWTDQLGKITKLMKANGYYRIHPWISKFDAWFVREDLIP